MSTSHILPTGQSQCYDENGNLIECHGSGQDPEFSREMSWPDERFEKTDDFLVLDRATGLTWIRNSCPSEFPLSWMEGLEYIKQLNRKVQYGRRDWRMPNRREIEKMAGI